VTEVMHRHWFSSTFPQNVPLVVLHPNFANQHLLLDMALNQSGRTPIFLTLQAPHADLMGVWMQLGNALADQWEKELPEYDPKKTPEKIAQAALNVFKSLAPFTLMIDAFDLADESVYAWILALVNGLPDGSQIVIGGRNLPLDLIENSAIQGKVELFPVDPNRMLLDYANQPNNHSLLEIYGLGPGQALINGRRIDRWDGLLPRSLFFYFIDRGMVTRDEIFETFWPTLTVREATNVFHVTKRKISEILGFDLTTYWSGFYRISPDIDLHYDVVKFAEDVQNSVIADDNEASPMLQEAIYLYRGLFLSTIEMPWAASRRSELRLTYADALTHMGKLRQRQGEIQEALGLYLRAATTQPHREDLARGIMSLFAELGQPTKALEIYQRLSDDLRHKLGVNPDRQTAELAEQIRAQG
jgi:DNA-binding SARP family transcriptional activator